MSELLRVKYKDLNYDIELDELKRFHIDSIVKSNREHFGVDRGCEEKAVKATETLFAREEYIYNWIDCKVKSNCPPPALGEAVEQLKADWALAEKKIIRQRLQKA